MNVQAHNTVLCDSLKIKFNKSLTKSRQEYLLHLNKQKIYEIKEEMSKLTHKVGMKLAEKKSANVVSADFAAFPNTVNVRKSIFY